MKNLGAEIGPVIRTSLLYIQYRAQVPTIRAGTRDAVGILELPVN